MQLELLVPLDTRELLACLVSVVALAPLDLRERRYALKAHGLHNDETALVRNFYVLV